MMTPDLLARILAALLALAAATDASQQTLQSLIADVETAQAQTTLAPEADLQAAMTSAPDGATLYLPAGVTYTGHFVCTHPVTLTTAGVTVVAGVRATPVEHGTLAILSSPDTGPALATAPGAAGCVVQAVEVDGWLQMGTGVETDVSQLPHDWTIQHVLVHATGLKVGIKAMGSHCAITDSYIDGPQLAGQDSQAIWLHETPGPCRIANNYLEAWGENLLIGGDRIRIPNLLPANIEIAGNTLRKPLTWQGTTGFNEKNLLEIKEGLHLSIHDNVLDGVWVDAQAGYALLLTPRNQYGDSPWVQIADVTIAHNLITHASSAINVLGDDNEFPSLRTADVTITNNRLLVDRHTFGGDGRCLMVGRGPQQVTYSQNTCISNGSSAVYTYAGGSAVTTIAGAAFVNNLWVHNTYGFMGEGVGEGNPALGVFYPGAVFTGNVMGGASAKLYPAGTLTPTMTDFQAQFADYANGVLIPNSLYAGKGAQ